VKALSRGEGAWRQLLFRYKGAKKADGDVKRTKEKPRCLRKVLGRLAKGDDFAKVGPIAAMTRARAGVTLGCGRACSHRLRGALFGMKPGERSGVVEDRLRLPRDQRLAE